jgi:hypothetical protein
MACVLAGESLEEIPAAEGPFKEETLSSVLNSVLINVVFPNPDEPTSNRV